MTLYLGFDGDYVLSRTKLYKHKDWDARHSWHYLAPRRGKCVSISEYEARKILGPLKLKKFEVVKLAVTP